MKPEELDEILHKNMRVATASGYARRTNAEAKVFDWDKAATLIAERNPQLAKGGLLEDWLWTAASIFEDGKIPEHQFGGPYGLSIWATPVLIMDGVTVDCWRYKSEVPEWDAGTYWPESARRILQERFKPAEPSSKKLSEMGGVDYGTRHLRIPWTDSGGES